MKTPRSFMKIGACAVLSFSLAAPAFSQGQMGQSEPQNPQMQQPGTTSPESSQQTIRGTDLMGSRVVTPDGDRLGTLDDLAVKLEDGQFAYAIVSSGGFLGIGGELHPVPPEALQTREVEMGTEIVLDITTDRWEDAPTVNRDQIHILSQETRGQEIYQFYGQDWQARQQRVMEFASPPQQREGQQDPQAQEPQQQSSTTPPQDQAQTDQVEQELRQAMTEAGVSEQQAQQQAQELAQQFQQGQPTQEEIQTEIEDALAQAGVEQQEAQQQARELSGQIHRQVEFAAPPQQRQPTPQVDQQPPQQPGTTPQTQSDSQPQGSEQSSDRFTFQEDQLQPASELNLASDLMAAEIHNQQQEQIGQIADFIVNPQDGRLAFVLITTESNFWEMTDDEYAVAPHAFEIREDNLSLNLTQQDLEVAQLLTPSQLQGQLEEMSGTSAQQARQAPEVFRYVDREAAPGVFGAPGRQVPEAEEEQPQQQQPQSRPTEDPYR